MIRLAEVLILMNSQHFDIYMAFNGTFKYPLHSNFILCIKKQKRFHTKETLRTKEYKDFTII